MNAPGDLSRLTPQLEGRVSAEEWQARVDLAAGYRLVALFGWDDLIFTHISARVPGPEHHFLINPYGMMFDEITASSLVKIDLERQGAATSRRTRSTRPASRSTARSTPRATTRSACCTRTRSTASRSRRRRAACCRSRSSRSSCSRRSPITTTKASRSATTRSRAWSATSATRPSSCCATTAC